MKIKNLLLLTLLVSMLACGDKKNGLDKSNSAIYANPEWVYNGVIYEVNTRQFTPEGTFNAFTAHLPRLKELGVDILWFMPIQSIGEKDRKGSLGSYYSIKNYTEVNKEFGTLQDFKNLVKEAHSMGFKVILDWVANHTSRDAVWDTEHPDWYLRDSLGNHVIKYDWTDIAELNYDKPELQQAMIQAMMFWLRETNIDGFRCDVANEVPTDFWVAASDSLKSVKPDIFLLAEAEEPALNESVFDAYYAWEFHHVMNKVAQGKSDVDSLRITLQKMDNRFASHAIPMYFTSNHDENSWSGTEFERMGPAAQSFAALAYMLPGIPMIYSGQEVGFNRRLQFFEKDSIDWSDANGFTKFYTNLNNLREHNPALLSQERDGSFSEINNDKKASVWSFKREKDNNHVMGVFNLSNNLINVAFDEEVPGKGYMNFPDSSSVKSVKQMELKPWEYKIFFKK